MQFYSDQWLSLSSLSAHFNDFAKAHPNMDRQKVVKSFLTEFYKNHSREELLNIRTELLEFLEECKSEQEMENAICDFNPPYNYAPWRASIQILLNELNSHMEIKNRS
jgi:hypothetical protein